MPILDLYENRLVVQKSNISLLMENGVSELLKNEEISIKNNQSAQLLMNRTVS